jgi:hypothetical protein
MALINLSRGGRICPPRFSAFPLLLLLVLGSPIYSQNGEGIPSPLTTEIQNIEKKLSDTGIPTAERMEAYIQLARLRWLSGNIDASAWAWREAGLADPENRDDPSLLESALCYMTLGEFEAAAAVLRIVQNYSTESAILRDVRYLSAQIEVFRTGNPSDLYSLLENPDFRDYRPAIYYTFWRLFSDTIYKKRILSEFPGSPEASILQGEEVLAAGNASKGSSVSALPRPLWFFFPGRENAVISAAAPISPVRLSAQTPPSTGNLSGSTGGPRLIQTGLFSREENAQAMVSRLASRGFTASVGQKTVSGSTYWAVTILPGDNPNQTMLQLKDAGFESFPVF